jgi:hypothetical protein
MIAARSNGVRVNIKASEFLVLMWPVTRGV